MSNRWKMHQKSIKNLSNMDQKSIKNRNKSRSGGLRCRFGGVLGRLGMCIFFILPVPNFWWVFAGSLVGPPPTKNPPKQIQQNSNVICFYIIFSLTFWMDFWSVLPPNLASKIYQNRLRIDAKMHPILGFILWSIFKRRLLPTSTHKCVQNWKRS